MTRRTSLRSRAPRGPTSRSSAAAWSACGRRSGSRSATRPATWWCWSRTSAVAARAAGTAARCCRGGRRPASSSTSAAARRASGSRRHRSTRSASSSSSAPPHGIDAEFHRGGYLWTATTEAQLGAWDSTVELLCELGAPALELLEPAEVARRTGSPVHLAGVLDPSAATVQPAKLARGLRRVALELGVRLHEHTRVTASRPPQPGRAADPVRRADRRPGRDRHQRLGRQPARAAHPPRRDHERHHPHRARRPSGWPRSAGRAARRSPTPR